MRRWQVEKGKGLVQVEARLPRPTGRYQIAPLPEATLGSLWVNWSGGIELTEPIIGLTKP